jgi:hypothetical protein
MELNSNLEEEALAYYVTLSQFSIFQDDVNGGDLEKKPHAPITVLEQLYVFSIS